MNEQDEQMEISPDVQGTIAGKRNEHFRWISTLGELIDNSFDSGATTVEIDVVGRAVTVTDNGNGCGDFRAMLTMGKHWKQKTTRLGRWGVGLKDAAWMVGGPTRISSVKDGIKRTLTVNWDLLSEWKLPKPFEEPTTERGTKISFLRIDRRMPDGKAFEDLVSEIGFIYTPAIKSGRQIVIRRGKSAPIVVGRFLLPKTDPDNTVDTSVIVDGKRVRIHVGVVVGENPRPGINYVHDFRVIIPSTALGCGGHGTRNIAGWVSLDEGWTLSRNKDDVSLHKEELGEAVFGAIRHIVAKASSHEMTLHSSSLAANLTSAFRSLIGGEKERRDSPKNNTGAVEPKNTGRRRLQFTKSQPGSSGTKAGRFTIQFGNVQDGAIGRVDYDGGLITLAENNLAIDQLKNDGNEHALLAIAVWLFSERDCASPQSLLSFVRDGSVSKQASVVCGRLLAELICKRPTLDRKSA